jgi:hypothetical protein
MKTKNNKGAMWEYLDQLGVLESGTDTEIKQAKRQYRKKYLLEYKRKQRKKRPEYTVNFSSEKGIHSKVVRASEKHNMSVSQFLRLAVLAYLDRKYIVPNPDQIAKLEQMLSGCMNQIQQIAIKKERFIWGRHDKLELIEKRIEKLEKEIDQIFRNPPLVQSSNDR